MFGLVVVGIALLIFWFRMGKSVQEFEGFAEEAYKMVMYGVDWCPHCVNAKPEFEKLGATQTIDGKLVEFAIVNPEKDKAAAEGKEIKGYPTIHLYKPDGSVEEYEGPRTHDAMLQFLKSKL
jgi:thiol-disulfide isomerase/thioredoxin